MITEYLAKNRIILDFVATDSKKILKKMLAKSKRKGHYQIIEAIMQRETLMPTALGKGIALPRIILDDKIDTEVIIAISPKGINFSSFDRLPVKIIFLHLFSRKDNYPSILAQSLRLLNDDSLRTELLKSKTEDEVINLIKTWEEE